MKKILLAVGLMAAFLSADARSFEEIKSSGVLKVGIPADYAPLGFYNKDKKLVGFDVDMAKNLAKSLKLKAEFVETTWPDLGPDLAADKYDIAVGGVTFTEKRNKEFILTQSIVPNGKVALARCEMVHELNSLEKINRPEIKVAVNPGGTNESFVNANITGATVIRVPDNFMNLQMIREKSADMMITDLIEGHYYEATEPESFCIVDETPYKGTESFKVYMLKKENRDLLKAVNLWLDRTDIKKMADKWNIELAEELLELKAG